MKEKLDELLCKKYPKIFVNRHAPITQTAMCWGFDCGDGWYNIIDQFCRNTQYHIDETNRSRVRVIAFNDALKLAVEGDHSKLNEFYTGFMEPYRDEYVERTLRELLYRDVPKEIPQVVAAQVKEKYGTLRFYYDGGDRYIDGMSTMAECMSTMTCEVCGNFGKLVGGGWVRTLCKTHAEEKNYSWSDEENETPTKD